VFEFVPTRALPNLGSLAKIRGCSFASFHALAIEFFFSFLKILRLLLASFHALSG